MKDFLELEGILEKIIYKSDDQSFLIGIFTSEEESFTVTGSLPKATEGSGYKIYGNFIFHKKYGEQFQIKRAEASLPKGEEAIVSFLSSKMIKGIGKAKAQAIVRVFGDRTLEIIENSPMELLKVKDIGKKTLEAIVEGYEQYGKSSKVYSYFHGLGFTSNIVNRIYSFYGDESIKLFEENPYEFTKDIRGLGFLKVDKIAIANGLDYNNPNRIKMGILHLLHQEAGAGHVYTEKERLISQCIEFLQVEEEALGDALLSLALNFDIKINFVKEERVYLMENFKMENFISDKIYRMSKVKTKELPFKVANLIKDTEERYGIEFSINQKNAIEGVLESPVSIITGGPGTGKTTIIRGLINIFSHGNLSIALTAPTGRAAKRITETTGVNASTIHRLLEYYADENMNMIFNKNLENPLDEKVVILDEASMVDLNLMYALLKALTDDCKFIIVGDEDQLQSVGIGNVLGDFISCGYIPCFKLKDIFRQAQESNIIVHSHEINQGILPTFANSKEGDLFYIERKNEKDTMELIKELVSKRLASYFPIENKVMDIQVISPSKKGHLGNENMNKELQNLLNPPETTKDQVVLGDLTLRCGDKVMHTKNNYGIQWFSMGDKIEGKGIFNGELGIVDSIDFEQERVYILFDEDKLAVYEYEDLKELSLGYSMTVHKSQGSEFPVVIIPLYNLPYMLTHRNLIYTAITRGKKGVVLVGDRLYLDRMVMNAEKNGRRSGLAKGIIECFERKI